MMLSLSSSSPSVGTIVSLVCVVLYSAGFIRVEFTMNAHESRINALEKAFEVKQTSANVQRRMPKNTADHTLQAEAKVRSKRQASGIENKTLTILRINKLLSEGRLQLCQRSVDEKVCPLGPGLPGPPGPRGRKGTRGRTGKPGTKGKNGIMGSPGKSGKQGIMGPSGFKGDTGLEGQKGEMGVPGMTGQKGEPGESISPPTVIVYPLTLTVNESEAASFQCSVNGNPEPAVTWSKLNSRSVLNQTAVSRETLHLRNVTANDSGVYQCAANNILGDAKGLARLIVNARPSASLAAGPLHFKEGSNVTLPKCHVTGYPPPVITWGRPVGQLPKGRVHNNNGALKIFEVRKTDSGEYVCRASNLLGTAVRLTLLVVVARPKFTVKPPRKVFASTGNTLILNCSATADPQPVISWKRQDARLPERSSYSSNGSLIIRQLKKEDSGNYTCVATSAEVSDVETTSDIEVKGPYCSNSIKAVSAPVTHSTRSSYTQGAWMKDPTGVMGTDTIFVLPSYSGIKVVEEFENLQKLKAGVARKKYQLPYNWDGTGAVVYRQYLYYNRENTRYIVKYNLQTERIEAQFALNGSKPRQVTYQWGGYSGVDFAVDEQGLWVLWGDANSGNRLTLGKIDFNRNVITQTWPLSTERMTSMGNAFVACGVVYCIDTYNANPTTINFAYDTKTGKQWNPNIQFNQYGYSSMVDYNPRENVLYAWDNKHLATYSLTFE